MRDSPTFQAARGAASVEHVGLCALIALLLIAAISALATGPTHAGRLLGGDIARKIACAPRIPKPCHRNPLALAYGFPVGKLVRALAPSPRPRIGPGGIGLVPVDFRRCRQQSCAIPSGSDPGLTASLRRVTAFTQVDDQRRRSGVVTVTYWLYTPTLGWEKAVRHGTRAQVEAAQRLRLRITDDPALVPLETLAGRNHSKFRASEQPPWRWKVRAVYPD